MKNAVLVLVAVALLVVGRNAFAYDPDALDYSFGTVKSISPTAIMLEEYDFEGDLEKTVQVSYVINGQTEFDNFEKIDELKVDEDVEVYFVEENGQKTAVSLAKDEGLEDFSDGGIDDVGEDGMAIDEQESVDETPATPVAVPVAK